MSDFLIRILGARRIERIGSLADIIAAGSLLILLGSLFLSFCISFISPYVAMYFLWTALAMVHSLVISAGILVLCKMILTKISIKENTGVNWKRDGF